MNSSGNGRMILNTYVVAVMVFLLLPIVIIVPLAFSSDASMAFPPSGFSLKWFEAALSRPEFLDAFYLSTRLAVVTTAISLSIGGLAAYALVRFRFRGRALCEALFLSPLIIPTVVIAIALTMILGQMGLLRNFWGLVIAHTIMTLPYAVRVLAASLSEIDRDVEEAALVLGATPARMLFHVLLPLLRPGILAASIFALIISFDEFTVTLFVAGPGYYTLPIEIFNYVEFYSDPTIAAISTLLVALSCVAIAIIERIVGIRNVFK
ncbi:ABC transporter permease [Microbaculum marinum]|uniref:ABC transporter permease n=1 Tax=Microbaculum marinum TaxID=1764581 RepID=A0AAW9RNJ7_9HYPH